MKFSFKHIARAGIVIFSFLSLTACSDNPGGPANGLQASPNDAPTAFDGSYTISDAVSDGVTFAPLSAAIVRGYGKYRTSAPMSDENSSYVKSVSFDPETSGAKTEFVVDGNVLAIEFDRSHADGRAFEGRIQDGYFILWSDTGSINLGDIDFSNSEYRFFERGGFFAGLDADNAKSYLGRVVYGLRTEPTGLPSGTATYSGDFLGRWHHAKVISNALDRGYTLGELTLTADFSESEVKGQVYNLRNSATRSGPGEPLPDGSIILIDAISFDDGQFNASMTGFAPAADVAYGVGGFHGELLGEFYGPAAEEVGGVFVGSRSTDGTVWEGHFGGKKN